MMLVRANLWPVAAAVVVGFLLLPIAQREYAELRGRMAARSEQSTPVVRFAARIEARDESSITVSLPGERLRGAECAYMSVDAYAVNAKGRRSPVNMERDDDIRQAGRTHPAGSYNFGRWRIWPLDASATKVLIFATHVCNAVEVKTLAAEVAL